MEEIKEVSLKEIGKVISTRKPRGLFLSETIEHSQIHSYIAVDNSNGNAWTEEFFLKEAAIKWLKTAHEYNYYDIKDEGDFWVIYRNGYRLYKHFKHCNDLEKIKSIYGL